MFALIAAKGLSAKVAPALNAVALGARGVVKAVTHRRQIWSLTEADDRLLKDIGLTRSDVAAALDTPFYADPSRNLALHSGGRGSAGFTSAEASLRSHKVLKAAH